MAEVRLFLLQVVRRAELPDGFGRAAIFSSSMETLSDRRYSRRLLFPELRNPQCLHALRCGNAASAGCYLWRSSPFYISLFTLALQDRYARNSQSSQLRRLIHFTSHGIFY